MGTPLPGIKRSGREADHSLPLSAEVENKWRYTSTLLVCLHDVDRENFAFMFNFIMATWHKYIRQGTLGVPKGLTQLATLFITKL